ncbi:MAG: hypothetical protein QNJ30_18820 [Kiloniellales bacterium]|nr:hypothetical protein [Kiloniellales bacterium]
MPRTTATLALTAGLLALGAASGGATAEPQIIELTQTACQFVESENGVDHGFETRSKADCEAVNAESGDERLAGSKELELKPGKYIFRVTNEDVPYELGFWLGGEGLGRFVKNSVSGGGLTRGVTRDYEIELTEGEYLYSCPLNPTPDYRIVVKS